MTKSAVREKFLRRFARTGLAAHGIVYCLMSVLSLLAAAGLKKDTAGKSDAFKLIYEQPLGRVVLAVIGVAMLGYVTLRFFQAFRDTRHKGDHIKALFVRAGMFFSGLVYLGLSFTALSLTFFKSGSGGEDGEEKKLLVSKALELPWGAWLVGISGAILIGSGVYQIARGVTKSFMKHVDLHRSDFKETFRRVGVVGHIARGVVFGFIGYLIIRAALAANPQEAESTRGAFDFMRENFGNALMGVVAAGLFAFRIFMLVRAKYEKTNFGESR